MTPASRQRNRRKLKLARKRRIDPVQAKSRKRRVLRSRVRRAAK